MYNVRLNFCKSESQKRKSEIKVPEQKLKSLNVKEDDLWKQCVKPQT
jgi:flagellar motility protein MotE (MotC chaperone)